MLVSTIVIIVGVMYNFYGDELMKQLHHQLSTISAGVEKDGVSYLESIDIADDERITWIDTDGSVKFDTDATADTMENHLNREEIKEAIEKGEGETVRYSSTLSERTMYYARLLPDKTIIRVSTNQYSVWILLFNMLQPLAIVMILSLVLSYIIAYFASKNIVMPINQLDLENINTVETYEEITPLVQKISHQNRVIREQIKELKQTQAEFNTITGNMKEGLLIVDLQGKILSHNKSAEKLLGVASPRGEYLEDLGVDNSFLKDISLAIHGTHMSEVIPFGDRYLSVYCNPVVLEDKVKGAVAVILDVTEKHQREVLRREFSANVSHELKTPLTAILASAEILRNENTQKETVTHFAGNITKEANRLITLVNDIIKLSKLDDKSIVMEMQEVDLFKIAKDVEDTLEPIASANNVTLKLYGEKTTLNGVPTVLSEIVYNLVDNAIKYNKAGGSVTVTVAPVDGKATLIVEDTGIGISKEDKSRVFERFYRVDKSHSKEIGGTGLGLSIVKHGVEYHKGTLSVESELGKGTRITVKI